MSEDNIQHPPLLKFVKNTRSKRNSLKMENLQLLEENGNLIVVPVPLTEDYLNGLTHVGRVEAAVGEY